MKPRETITRLQEFYLLAMRGLMGPFRRPLYLWELVDQMDYLGAGSLVIVVVVLLFIGMALSLQIAAEFAILGLQMYTGRVVGISVISEIGPVVTALVFAGRAGSGMSSELGGMVLRHQVDTLHVFGVDPVRKLVTPRIVGSIAMLPVLTIIGDAVAILGGYYMVVFVNNQSGLVYWDSIRLILLPRYVIPGAVKPFVFGLVIAAISCYTGMSTRGGAVGLRGATTRSFVLSTISIIVADFVVTKLILFAFGYAS